MGFMSQNVLFHTCVKKENESESTRKVNGAKSNLSFPKERMNSNAVGLFKVYFTDVPFLVQWFVVVVRLAALKLRGDGERCSEVSKLVPLLTQPAVNPSD